MPLGIKGGPVEIVTGHGEVGTKGVEIVSKTKRPDAIDSLGGSR